MSKKDIAKVEKELEVNERLVKLSMGKVPIMGELKLGDDVQILMSGTVVKEEHEDMQDGSYNLVFIVKGEIAYVNEEKIG